jgi:hypothetical protein
MLCLLQANLVPAHTPLASQAQHPQLPGLRVAKRMEVGLGWLLARPPRAAGPVLWHNGGTGGFRSFVAVVREPTRPWSCSATPPDRSAGWACACSRRWPAAPARALADHGGNRVSSASGPGSR